MGVRKYLSEVLTKGRVIVHRGHAKTELFRMASNSSMRTSLNHKLVWRYRSIRNPCVNANHKSTGISIEPASPIVDVPDAQPIAPEYNDEIYLCYRFLAFERYGWKCA